MKLFDTCPYIKGDRLIIHEMSGSDMVFIREMLDDPLVYRYLPTFIAGMDDGTSPDEESILMGIYLADDPETMAGIAEIYNYNERKSKVSIGCRLLRRFWGKGIATCVVGMLKEYILDNSDVSTITAHIMRDNIASSKSVKKNGFINKYPGICSDWGFGELTLMDKYVYKREWIGRDMAEGLPDVQVEQFVMAYGIEQDRIRALLPEGYRSLRPVLRINSEIRDERKVYVEFNTPVEADGRRGWLNIDCWKSTHDEIGFTRDGETVVIEAPFLKISYRGTGIEGGCPAEKDNEGCYYIGHDVEFRPAEKIDENKEFCDCEFEWRFNEGDAHGASEGRTVPAFETEKVREYEKRELTAANAAAIPCRQVLGAYIVRFARHIGS